MLRIISGKVKGKKLATPKGKEIRPTPVRLRKRLFDILGYDVVGSSFLDGFAGTGAVGLEAYSLGAEKVVFIESDPLAIKILRKNIERVGNPPGIRVVEAEFNIGVRQLHEEGEKFHFVFIDPPYDFLQKANPLKILYKKNILEEDGLILLQKPCQQRVKKMFFPVVREIKEGKNCILFLRREE